MNREPDTSEKKYNEEIQTLRAIAICLVLISHAITLFPWNPAGWADIGRGFYVGVDLFLCLSGYVIAKSLGRNLAAAEGAEFWRQTAAFWVRRFYRITPSAWVWLFVPLVIYSVARGYSHDDAADVVSALAHVANIRSWECAWVVKANCGSFGHYWSLSLEEQFYLLLPFLVLFFRKHLPVALGVTVILQVFLPRPLGSVFGAIKTDALLLGVLLAIWSGTRSYRIFDPKLSGSPLRFIVPAMAVACLVGMTRYEPVPFFIGMAAVISALIVWLCSFDAGYFMGDGPLRKVLVWIGERSFSIYLIHPFAFWLTKQVLFRIYPGVDFDGTYTIRFAGAGVVIMMVLVEISYRLVEVPFRLRGVARARKVATASEPVMT